jgi:hypothetical protein
MSRVRTLLSHLTRRSPGESAQTLVLAALFLPVLLGFAGLAIDVGMAMKHRTDRQRTADAAALAGAQFLAYNPFEIAEAKQIACDYAQKNGYGNGNCNNDEVEVYVPPISGPYAGQDGFVEVIVTRTDNTFFLRVLGVEDATVKARAVGGSVPRKRNYALIVLNPTQCNSYTHSSSNINIEGGGAIVNSDATTGGNCIGISANQGGNSIITARNCKDKDLNEIPCTLDYHPNAEKWGQSNNAQNEPEPTRAPPFPDPLTCGPPLGNQAEEVCPRPVACDAQGGPSGCVPASICSAGTASNLRMTSINNVGSPQCRDGDKLILYPGTYYGGITLQEGSVKTVEFKAGLYVLAGGASGSKGGLNCCPTSVSSIVAVSHNGLTGITIFNTDFPSASSPNDRICGQMKLTGAGSVNISAPTVPHTTILSGYKNMLFWQSETCANYGSGNNPSFDFSGGGSGGAWTTSGIIYLPLAHLKVTGGGDFGSVMMIVNTFSFGGSQDLQIRFTRFIDTDTIQYKLVE